MTFYIQIFNLQESSNPGHISVSLSLISVVLTLIRQTTNNYSGILYLNSLFGKLLTYTILALENTGHGHPQGLSQVIFTYV